MKGRLSERAHWRRTKRQKSDDLIFTGSTPNYLEAGLRDTATAEQANIATKAAMYWNRTTSLVALGGEPEMRVLESLAIILNQASSPLLWGVKENLSVCISLKISFPCPFSWRTLLDYAGLQSHRVQAAATSSCQPRTDINLHSCMISWVFHVMKYQILLVFPISFLGPLVLKNCWSYEKEMPWVLHNTP